MNGVEGMLYMFSQATSDGALTLTITFALGIDLDNAQVQVQNRVAQTLPRLPQDVQRIGVTTEKASPDFIMVVHLVSPDERYDMLYLSNYAHLQVRDELTRLPGVGSAQVFGAGETACASGSIRIGWRRASSPPATWSVPSASRTSRLQRACWGRHRRRPTPPFSCPSTPRAASARSPSSATSWCGRPTTGRSRGYPTSPAWSSARAVIR